MSARRLGARRGAGLLVVAAVALQVLSGASSGRVSKPPVCRDGRFVTPSGAPPLLAGLAATVPDALIVEGGTSTIAIAGRCPAVRVRLRGTKRGTKVTAVWPKNACGPTKVRLKATIDPGCHTMEGVLRASRFPPTGFIAPRCGDGALDNFAGEMCDGDAGCGAGEACSPDCRCVERTLPDAVSFSGEVQPIFNARCAVPFCHSGAVPTQGLDLSEGRSYVAIVNRPSTERPALELVNPGAPEMSYLAWKIGGAPAGETILGSPMPLSGGPLSATEQATIRKWIAQGALGDSPVATTTTSTTLATVPSTSTTTVSSTTTTSTTSPPPPPVSFGGDVQPIFTARCAVLGCHVGPFPAQGLELAEGSSWAAIVGQPSTEKPEVKLVDAGSATTSYLLWKISEAPAGEFIVGSMMPFSGGFLSVAEVAAIRTWVTEGALDN
ncbi:MAG: hypothetical protein E6J79_19445 [Deltaproteobacteria bacterium]|nr:MAG: hypothetical protein E6J79_19445 [Deltaproteobacteria bacterium]